MDTQTILTIRALRDVWSPGSILQKSVFFGVYFIRITLAALLRVN